MLKKIVAKYFQITRIKLFCYLSESTQITGNPIVKQPLLVRGKGKINFGNKVQLGYFPSPYFFEGSIYLEARTESSIIEFGSDIFCNNNLKIICEASLIKIGSNVLMGTNVEIIDSDFHELHPNKRNSGNHECLPVIIGNNVFIGSNVKILKGVTIGNNTVIANSAIVTMSFPENVIVGGFPAKIISYINPENE